MLPRRSQLPQYPRILSNCCRWGMQSRSTKGTTVSYNPLALTNGIQHRNLKVKNPLQAALSNRHSLRCSLCHRRFVELRVQWIWIMWRCYLEIHFERDGICFVTKMLVVCCFQSKSKMAEWQFRSHKAVWFKSKKYKKYVLAFFCWSI